MVSSRTSDWRAKIDEKMAALSLLRDRVSSEREALAEVRGRIEAIGEALHLTQGVAQEVQTKVHSQIAHIVTRCLLAVFPVEYEFRLVFERKRGRTEAIPVVLKEGQEVDPMESSGGGLVDVIGFGLRLACLLLHQPPLRRVLILDEPFRFVDKTLRPEIRTLLETLSQEMGVQIVLVTHDPGLRMGRVVSFFD